MRQTQSITIILSCSVEVSRIETTSVQAAAESPLEHEWDATVTRSDLLAIWGLPNNPERFLVTSS